MWRQLSKAGIAGGLFSNIQWHIGSFGLLLPLGLIGLFWLRRLHKVIIFLIAGSLLVINIFEYRYSFDIIKFSTVAQIILAITSAGVLAKLWDQKIFLARALSILLILIGTYVGFAFHGYLWAGKADWYFPAVWRTPLQNQVTIDEGKAITWLRHNITAGDGVICPSTALAESCSIFGGFPQLWLHYFAAHHGYNVDLITNRRKLIENKPVDCDAYANANIRWAIVSNTHSEWLDILAKCSDDGSAKPMAIFDQTLVYHLLPSQKK